jgi:tetratricopeptide (TPR) repeat protein
MNKKLIVGLILTLSFGAQAQTLKDAKKKAENERYELAKADFKALIQKDPANVEYAFSYGNLLWSLEDEKGAIEQFKAAAAKNPEDKLAQVSGAKAIYLSGDTTTAGQQFQALLKSTKQKNVCVLMGVAETYATGKIKNLPLAEAYLKKVLVLEPNNIQALQMLGDVILDQSTSRVSEAVEKYNQVLKLEPTNVVAIVKKAFIYERVNNIDAAIEGYEQAIKIDPNFGPAYRHMAEVQMSAKKDYEKSAALWTKYLQLNDDPEARYRYATSLFVGKKYTEALAELDKVEKAGIINFYTKRMIFYSMLESNTTGDVAMLERTQNVALEFFKLAPEEKVIGSDYNYMSQLYMKLGKKQEAIDILVKSVNKNKDAGEQLATIGNTAFKSKDFKLAIAAYQAKWDAMPDKFKGTEAYELGRAYYFDTDKNFKMADSAFSVLTRTNPSFALGYFWKARALTQTDLDVNKRTYIAQPYYQLFIDKLTDANKADASYKEYIKEASLYLGDYYVNSPAKDAAKARIYWQQVRDIDPANEQAKIYFKMHP